MSVSSTGANEIGHDKRIVVYLSGGGYRAAVASIGALMAIISSGQWDSVRKVVSVSGGGLVNAWLATRRPPNEEDALRSLDELYSFLTNRKRSIRQLLITGAMCVTVAGLLVGLGLVLVARMGDLFWAYALVALVVMVGVLVWLAPRVFLAMDFRHYRGRLGSLEGTGWFREHVFVASDLWSARYVAFIAHTELSLIAAPPMRPIGASALDFRSALRASTALPPVLPAVRIGVAAPRADRENAETSRREASFRRSLWLVDGGVTGNLGIQSDPGITGLSTRFDGLLAARRAVAASIAMLSDDLEGVAELSARSAMQRENLIRYLHVQAVRLRWPSNYPALEAIAAARAKRASTHNAEQRDADDDLLTPDERQSRRVIREEAAAILLALEAPQLRGFVISDDERKALEEPVVVSPARSPGRTPRPNCGHGPGPWSACTECPTFNIVVDASGRPAKASRFLRILLWLPGLSTLVNAVRTLQVLYQENLQEDRKSAHSFTASVVQADDIYLREARVGRSKSEIESGARWALAEMGLAGQFRASMPEGAFVRAQLREDAARLKTTLTAPPSRMRGSAHAALASGYLGARDLFATEITLDAMEAELASLDGSAATAIRLAVAAARKTHRDESAVARARRLAWVLGLREGFAEFARARGQSNSE